MAILRTGVADEPVDDDPCCETPNDPLFGACWSGRGISGRIISVIRTGDRYLTDRLKRRSYWGASFAVVRDDAGRSHHVLLDEVA